MESLDSIDDVGGAGGGEAVESHSMEDLTSGRSHAHAHRRKPIITITSDSFDQSDSEPLLASPPRPTPRLWAKRLSSTTSDEKSLDDPFPVAAASASKEDDGIPRCSTDSKINYTSPDETEEANGSVFYIDKDGHINLNVCS